MRCLPRARVVDLLTAQLATTRSIDVELDSMKSQWPDAGEPPHAAHLLDLWRGTFQSHATWTAAMLDRITRGEFRFVDDDGG